MTFCQPGHTASFQSSAPQPHNSKMGRKRSMVMVRQQYLLLAAVAWTCCPRAKVVFVSGFGLGFGNSSPFFEKTLSAGGRRVASARGVRRRRQEISLPEVPKLSSDGRRRAPFVGEAPASSTLDWRDLGPEEERALCEHIVENRRVMELQAELERTQRRPVTVHEWAVAAGHPSAHQLMAALQEGRKAERTIVLCHQELVRSVANRYKKVTRNLSLDDLTQEGNVGLLQAVGKFDPTKGTRFSSYAVFRIKASILRAVADKDRLVRVPVHAQDAAMRILAASHALELETGQVPTDTQIALALSMPEETVSLYRASTRRDKMEDIDDPAVGDLCSSEGRIRGERWPWDSSQIAQPEVVRQDILRVMRNCLSPTEERVLRLRFGFEGGGKGGYRAGTLTFKEIGRTMELSAEGIRQMAFRAIAKLQESDEASCLLLAYADMV